MGSGFSTRSVMVPDPVAGCLPASLEPSSPRDLARLSLSCPQANESTGQLPHGFSTRSVMVPDPIAGCLSSPCP